VADLFDLVKEHLSDDLLGAIGGRLGLGRTRTDEAVGLGIPALLGGLSQHAERPEGASALLDRVNATNGGASLDGLLDRLRGRRSPVDDENESFLEKVLGGGLLDQLTGRLGGANGSGMGKGLLGMLLPLVIGALGKLGKGGLNPASLVSALTGATGRAADAAPGGRGRLLSLLGPLAGALGLGGVGAAAATSGAWEPVAAAGKTVHEPPPPPPPAEEPDRDRRGAAWLWGAGALGLGLIVAFASGAFGDNSATPSAAAPTTTEARVTTAEPEPSGPVTDETPARFLTARGTGRPIILDGPVPDDATKTAVGDAAATAFGAENVDNQLRVEAGGTGPDTATVGRVLDALGDGPQGWTAIWGSADVLTLVGEVASEADKTAIGDAAAAAFAPGTVDNQLTVAAGGDTVEEINRQIRLRGVTFVTGSAELTPRSRTTLDRVAAILADAPDVRAEVQGHTDNVGNAAANQRLSQRRAASVVTYLAGKGIGRNRLVPRGYGQTQPVAPNNTNAGRAANRRVVFQLL
jgi:outer membrane protein OmpA-like peptidoglycan-associated protein